MRAVGLGGTMLTVGQLRARGIQPVAGFGQLDQQLLFGDRDLLGLCVQRVRVGVAVGHRLDVEMLSTLVGDAHRGAHSFGQCRQPEPGVLNRLRPGRELGQRRLVSGQLFGRDGQAGSGLVVLATHRRLGFENGFALGAPAHHIVGGQPGLASRRSA